MASLSSESAFLACIDRHFPNTHPHMERGRGDDCAIVRCSERLCISSDLFLENVHFRRSYFSPADIGYKALAVNLSDIAAMGAVPLGFSLDLMVPVESAAPAEGGYVSPQDENITTEARPEDLVSTVPPADCHMNGLTTGSEAYWDAFFGGMAELAAAHTVALTGGDLSKAPYMGTSITVWGAPVTDEAGNALPLLQRGTPHAGDVIFILGDFGLARVGLLALESMGRDAQNLYPRAVAAHLRPVPRVGDGQALARLAAQRGGADCGICLMDLSDGLARDLPRLLGTEAGSKLCAELEVPTDALPEEIVSYCLANDLDALEQALLGGEDYALVGTCPANLVSELQDALPHARVLGRVARGETNQLNGLPWEACGFDHFA